MRTWFLSAIAGLGLLQSVAASDYTLLFDPATMTVGQTLGEYLVVKEYCPKDSCLPAEKLKYVTAQEGRTGRLEMPVSAGSDFEISFNIGSNGYPDLTITLYLSDNTSLALDLINGSVLSYPGGLKSLNWTGGAINDFRLVASQGILKISANDTFTDAQLNLSGTINRLVISKISDGEDKLFEIRTRGIQTACTGTGGNTTARVGGISTNAFVGSNPADYMIAGVFINNGSRNVLIRASSVDGVFDPKLTVQSFPDGTVLYTNSSWGSDPSAAKVKQLNYTPAKTTDAAMIVTLPKGLFTFTVSPEGAAGKGLIEVYEVE